MRETRRRMDELPWDSPERQLFAAGKALRPPKGAIDADWQMICGALGIATATTAVATKAIAATALAAKTGSTAPAALATKAIAGGVGLSLVPKSIAIGFAVGVGVIGAGTVVTRTAHNDSPPSAIATRSASPAARQAQQPLSAANQAVAKAAAPVPEATDPPAASAKIRTVEFPELEELPLTRKPTQMPSATARQPVTADEAPSVEPPSQPASLARPPQAQTLLEQAQGLAQVKRLIDAGASDEALRRLRASYTDGVNWALAEERDALYVQALDTSQRRAEARVWANRFLKRYPNSPHVETMRRLTEGK